MISEWNKKIYFRVPPNYILLSKSDKKIHLLSETGLDFVRIIPNDSMRKDYAFEEVPYDQTITFHSDEERF